MTPLMEIAKTANQPEGGFLPVYCLEQIYGAPDKDLHPFYMENLPPRFASTLVDSISKFLAGAPLETAFHRTIVGAEMAEEYYPDSVNRVKWHLARIRGIDRNSIFHAFEAVQYNDWYYNFLGALVQFQKNEEEKPSFPNRASLENVQLLIERSMAFFEVFGPVVQYDVPFSPNGYTGKTKGNAESDFLTKDTLWEFRVSRFRPNCHHTLQMLMYYIMGKHSQNPLYDTVTTIGIYNPFLDIVFRYNMSDMPVEYLREVELDILGFRDSVF